MSNSEEMDDAFSNMIQQIALIEHQNREVVQKYREIEHKIKAIRFRYTKRWGVIPITEKQMMSEINKAKRNL
tara:strand:- start:357 stop:572 length:216 start_codon:yes stop_codon:yes gene_type:complete